MRTIDPLFEKGQPVQVAAEMNMAGSHLQI
jgi:hypothetical protein